MAFHLGSLGFLTSFRFRDFRDKITDVLTGKFNPCNKNFKIIIYEVCENCVLETIQKLTNPCLPAIVTVLPDTKNRPTVTLQQYGSLLRTHVYFNSLTVSFLRFFYIWLSTGSNYDSKESG